MRKDHIAHPAPIPERKELSDTPVKLCCEISRLFHAKLREGAQVEGVMSQPGAGLVLSLLAAKDGISQKELVKETHLRPPSISVIIKKMAAENIVRTESDKNDLRVTKIYLTDNGRALDTLRITRVKQFDALAHASLSDDESKTLMLLLGKIRKDLMNERGCQKKI